MKNPKKTSMTHPPTKIYHTASQTTGVYVRTEKHAKLGEQWVYLGWAGEYHMTAAKIQDYIKCKLLTVEL